MLQLFLIISLLFIPPAYGAVKIEDEGVNKGYATTLDFIGDNVTATRSGVTGIITVSGGSGPSGSGTANYVPKWSDSNTLADSVMYDDATNIGIGTTSPTALLDVNGDIELEGQIVLQTDKSVVLDTYTDEGINAGIDLLGAGGGEVKLLEGSFTTDAQIDIDVNATSLIGTGYGSLIDASGWSADHVLDLNATDYGLYRNFRIEGNSGGGNTNALIYDNGVATYNVFDGIYVIDSDYRGMHLDNTGSDFNKVVNSFFIDNDLTALRLDSDYNTVMGNHFIGSGGAQMQTYANYNTIGNNIFANGSNIGFYSSGNFNTYSNNIFQNNSISGTQIKSDWSTLSSNVAYLNDATGIDTDQSTYMSRIGNVAYRNGNGSNDLRISRSNNIMSLGEVTSSTAGYSEYGMSVTDADNSVVAFLMSGTHDSGGIIVDANCDKTLLAFNYLEDEAVSRITDNGTNTMILDTNFGTFELDINCELTSSYDDLGWSVQSAANQVCTTTCTHAAVVGFDNGVGTMVGTSDATADVCLCAGES